MEEKKENRFYVYAYLDPRKNGIFKYGNYIFEAEPFYIGKGSGKRKYDHLKETKESSENIIKYRKINKIRTTLRCEPIIVEINNFLSESDAYNLEIGMIALIGTIKDKSGPLTNIHKGGNKPPSFSELTKEQQKYFSNEIRNRFKKVVVQYDLKGNFIKIWNAMIDAEIATGINASSIGAACDGRIKTAGGFIWRFKTENEILEKLPDNVLKGLIEHIKPEFIILQYTKFGCFINEWQTFDYAANGIKNETNLSLHRIRASIRRVCNGERNSFLNYIWKYKYGNMIKKQLEIEEIEKIINPQKENKKSILQYSMDGIFIKEWESIKIAKLTLKINNISNVLNGKRLTAGNFIWRFKDSQIIPQKIIVDLSLSIGKAILQYTKNSIFIKKWINAKEAERELKTVYSSAIYDCVNYKNKTTGGFIWRYATDPLPNTPEF